MMKFKTKSAKTKRYNMVEAKKSLAKDVNKAANFLGGIVMASAAQYPLLSVLRLSGYSPLLSIEPISLGVMALLVLLFFTIRGLGFWLECELEPVPPSQSPQCSCSKEPTCLVDSNP